MSRRTIGTLLLLAGSELLGILAGQRFFHLFLKTIPPVAVSAFSQSAAHGAFLLYGAFLGLALFVWSLLAVVVARFFAGRSEASVRGGGAGG